MRKSLKITKDLTNKIGILIHVPKTAGRSFGKVFIKDDLYVRSRHATALFLKNNQFEDRENDWDRLYKIAWVRNPWERVLSLWKFRYHRERATSMHISKEEMVKNLNSIHKQNKDMLKIEKEIIEGYTYIDDFKFWLFNYDMQIPKMFCRDDPYNRNPLTSLTYVSDLDENIIVDFIGRFEHLDEDVDKLNKKFNHNYKVPRIVEHDKSLGRRLFLDRGFGTNYQDYYDDESREYIAEVCKWEIEKFNYKFEKKA